MDDPEITVRPAVPDHVGQIAAFIRDLAAYERLAEECLRCRR